MVVVLVVPLLLVAFVLGHRLGGDAAPLPSQVAVASAPPAASASPDEPLIDAGTVSEALRQAYYAAGGGLSICAASEEPRCISATGRELPSEPVGSDLRPEICALEGRRCAPYVAALPAWLATLSATAIPAGRTVVAADLSGAVALGGLLRLSPLGLNPERTSLPAPVNPDAQGIEYLDLGWLEPGRYLVVISRLVAIPYPAVESGVTGWEWRPTVVALNVLAG